jgi:hypothetical protein
MNKGKDEQESSGEVEPPTTLAVEATSLEEMGLSGGGWCFQTEQEQRETVLMYIGVKCYDFPIVRNYKTALPWLFGDKDEEEVADDPAAVGDADVDPDALARLNNDDDQGTDTDKAMPEDNKTNANVNYEDEPGDKVAIKTSTQTNDDPPETNNEEDD